jgi:hypothetical protein
MPIRKDHSWAGEAILTMELPTRHAASLSGNRLAPLKRFYFGSNEGRGLLSHRYSHRLMLSLGRSFALPQMLCNSLCWSTLGPWVGGGSVILDQVL